MHRQDPRSPTKVISVSKEKGIKRKKEKKKKSFVSLPCLINRLLKKEREEVDPLFHKDKMQRFGW